MKSALPIAGIAAAGFMTGWLATAVVPRKSGKDESALPHASSRRTADFPRTWLDPKVAKQDRMTRFIEQASSLSGEEWPAFFASLAATPEWSRLAARLWAEQDPSGFWSHLRGQHDLWQLEYLAPDLLKTWAIVDPDAAMTAALEVTEKSTGERLRRTIVDSVLDRDLVKGLELAGKAGEFNSFSWGPRGWINKDPEVATRGLLTLPEYSEYRDFLRYAVEAWTTKDPKAVLEWMKEGNPPRGLNGKLDTDTIAKAFETVAKTDVSLALENVTGLADSEARDKALAGILRSGKLSGPDMSLLLERCTLSTQAEVIDSAISALPKSNAAELAAATEVLVNAPAGRSLLNATGSLASHWSRVDWEGSWEWARSLPNTAMRRAAIESLVESTTHNRYDELATKLSGVPILDLSNNTFASIVSRLPEGDREEWISKLPADRAEWARSVVNKP